MAENKLEGFEDFDSLLGEEQGSESGGGISSELDDLLGGEEGGGQQAQPAEGGDSELDSFFEDLSTIDDLEVLQEEDEGPPPEEPAPAPAAAAPAREERRPPPRRAAAPRRERSGPGFFGRLFRFLILMGILAGAAYAVYWFFFPSFEVPWQVVQPPPQPPPPQQVAPPPPPPPEPEPAPPPEPKPEPKPQPRRVATPRPRPQPKPQPRPAPQRGPYKIQVATCFFDSCVAGFRGFLEGEGYRVTLRSKTAQAEALEIYSSSAFSDRVTAQALADRINDEHPLEGHAYVYSDNGRYRISMGVFPDLGRANVVRDSLNQQFAGDVMFSTRLKTMPYRLRSVLAGGYGSRAQAERALDALKNADPRFSGAFVTRD